MKNAKKLLYMILFLFLTVIFQIGFIIKLNRLEKQANQKITLLKNASVYGNSGKDKDIENPKKDNVPNENEEETTFDNNENNGTDAPQILKSQLNDYSDIDTILSDENLKNIFGNSMFIGDSRTESLRKFTQIGSFADFCCDVGVNITKLVTNTFFIQNENITIYDAVSKHSYDKLFISIGYNELGWKYEDTFIEKYSALIDELKRLSPDSEIFVQSILCITNDSAAANEMENNERIRLYNSKIAELCALKNVHYIDLNPDFTNADGFLMSDATTDGIHLTSEYCKRYVYKLINAL